MKTLQDIKNNYAQEQGHEDWDSIWSKIYDFKDVESVFSEHYDEICIRAQKAALERAYESINADDVIKLEWGNIHKSITNPENLTR